MEAAVAGAGRSTAVTIAAPPVPPARAAAARRAGSLRVMHRPSPRRVRAPWAAAGRMLSVTVAVPPPCAEPGCWAGAPSAVVVGGVTWLAYRLRLPEARGRGVSTILARGGGRFTPVVELGRERFGAASLERPALVVTPDGTWRLYVSCATPGSKHWRIDLLEAATPEGLAGAEPRTVFAGSADWGVKDPVIRYAAGRWHVWVCGHPLDVAGEEDRMVTRYA